MGTTPSVDLHVHSTFSDGRLRPDELAERAVHHNVTTLAITDHDTMSGSDEKEQACRRHGIECVQGVELSCELDGREAHILSLFADPNSPYVEQVDALSSSRYSRMEAMLDRLGTMGIHVNMEDLPVAVDGVYGRPHLARALMEKGVVKSVKEAFARYLYDSGPIHIAKTRLTAGEGIDLAKRLGGVAILAHPGVSGLLGDLEAFQRLGLDGVEVYHPKHGGETIAKLLRFCREQNLLVSGGSDFHSPGDGPEIGAARVPGDIVEPLRRLAAGR
ncbi:MAG: PHP domain-containing protein [Planctomycetaceae bacterium]|nr:PHP domain-containing protein [Planctomycetaceae bacterium]